MSTHPSSPDAAVDELKRRARRRLMGAIVLALAAAVILPMLLESDPKPLGNDVSIQIPPIDSGKFVTPLSLDNPPVAAAAIKPNAEPETKVAATPPVPDPAPSRAMNASEQRVLGHPATVVMPSAPMRPVAKPETPAPSAPAPVSAAPKTPPPAPASAAPKTAPAAETTAAAVAPSAAAAGGTLVVQVAALADAKAAADLATKLSASGFDARVEPVATSHGPIQRVRVGAYSSRDAADAAVNKIKAAGYATAIVTSK